MCGFPAASPETVATCAPLAASPSAPSCRSFLIEIGTLNDVICRFRRDKDLAPGTPPGQRQSAGGELLVRSGETMVAAPAKPPAATAGGDEDAGAGSQRKNDRGVLLKWDTACLPWHIAAVPRDLAQQQQQLMRGVALSSAASFVGAEDEQQGASRADLSPVAAGAGRAGGPATSWWSSPAVARGWTLQPVYGKMAAGVTTAGAAPF